MRKFVWDISKVGESTVYKLRGTQCEILSCRGTVTSTIAPGKSFDSHSVATAMRSIEDMMMGGNR